jgi:hypothetical protein
MTERTHACPMNMAAASKSSAAYLVLLLASLAVPGFHYSLTNRSVEHTRMGTGLLPAHTLLLRWLGELSCTLPVVAVVFCFLSFRCEWFRRASTLFGVAALQLGFITAYAVYCAYLLSHMLLGR